MSVIVVSFETCEATLACVRSLVEYSRAGTEVIVVDNASADGTPAALAEAFPTVRILVQPENLGFARAANVGARAAVGRDLFFVNSDCVLRAGTLERLEAFLADHPESAATVPRLLFADGTVQRNVNRLPTLSSIAAEYVLGRVATPTAWRP